MGRRPSYRPSVGGLQQADVRVSDGCVEAVGHSISPAPADEIIDVAGLLVLPGIIDAHTHFDLDTGRMRTRDNFLSGSQLPLRIAGGRRRRCHHVCQFCAAVWWRRSKRNAVTRPAPRWSTSRFTSHSAPRPAVGAGARRRHRARSDQRRGPHHVHRHDQGTPPGRLSADPSSTQHTPGGQGKQ